MKKTLATLVASIGLLQLWLPLNGCSMKQQITYSGPDPKVIDTRSKITFADGHTQDADNVEVRPDSVLWQEAKTMKPFTAHHTTISSVEWKDHGRGALAGLANGFLGGVLFGGFLGLGAVASKDAWADVVAIALMTVFGAMGMLFGLAGGAMAGYTTRMKVN